MPDIALKGFCTASTGLFAVNDRLHEIRRSPITVDRWVVVVIIALALIIAMGLAAAWFYVCQKKGMYPALDMPAFKDGGTWKAYCKK